jgi:hypothetical protein
MTHKLPRIAALPIVALIGMLAAGTAVAKQATPAEVQHAMQVLQLSVNPKNLPAQPDKRAGSAAAAVPQSSAAAAPQSSGSDPTVGVLPTANDVYANWKNAGLAVIGGIPSRATVCATVNPRGGGLDDLSNIQTAIDNCPAGQVVQLGSSSCAPSCVFSITMSEFISLNKGITLRGYGACNNASSPYCATVIKVKNGALPTYVNGGQCGTDSSHIVACVLNPAILMSPMPDGGLFDYGWSSCDHNAVCNSGTPLASDAAQGASTVQVASTSSFSVGMWVLVDEASGAGWQTDPINAGQVWAASDWLSSSASPATGRVAWEKHNPSLGVDDFGSEFPYQANSAGCWYSNCDRPTAELHLVKSIGAGPCPGTGCTLTFDDPLTVAFRVSGHQAAVYYPSHQLSSTSLPFLQQAGVENLTIERGTNGNIQMLFCAYCWVKNVESFGWFSGGVDMDYTVRSQIDTSYIHDCYDCENNGAEYAIALSTASTENLVTNSIITLSGKGMVGRTGAANVISYNYQDDTFYMANSIGDYWVDNGINGSHYAATHHYLFEGNWADNCGDDFTHGNTVYHVYFRNSCTGLRTPFTDPSNGYAENDYTGHAWQTGGSNPTPPTPMRAVGIMAWDYWEAYVGNVLGVSGTTTTANQWAYSAQDWNAGQTGSIWLLGWNNWDNTKYDPNLGSSTPYVFRHGNYDYLNNAVSWDAGTPDHTLPNSFYLTQAPAFFGGYPWPWVTPTGSSQLYTLPAKARHTAGAPFGHPPNAVADDFDGSGRSAILWRNAAGSDSNIWLMNGSQVASTADFGGPGSIWHVAATGDFTGSGVADILWQDTSGNTVIWFMSGGKVASSAFIGQVTGWSVAGTGDFTGSGTQDILWRNNTTGDVSIWLMNGGQVSSAVGLGAPSSAWQIAGTGDFDGNGTQDILWRNNTTGDVSIWFMNNQGQVSSTAAVGAPPTDWQIAKTGDFDGSGRSAILWRDTNGTTAIWFMNGAQVTSSPGLGAPSTNWQIKATGDFAGDGRDDILWQDTSGNTVIWFMNGAAVTSSANLGAISPSIWSIVQ